MDGLVVVDGENVDALGKIDWRKQEVEVEVENEEEEEENAARGTRRRGCLIIFADWIR